MAKELAILGLIFNLFGVITLFLFGMPYRIETKGQSALLLEEDDAEAIRVEAIYRTLGFVGLFLVVAGTALQIWSVVNA